MNPPEASSHQPVAMVVPTNCRSWKRMTLISKKYTIAKSLMSALIIFGGTVISVEANGLGEDRSWQFDTSADKANKAAVLDLIERKKGGYYDSFDTTVNNYTYIGTQISCSNSATATGNISDNSQVGNAPVVSAGGTVTANTTGNTSTGSSTGGGLGGGGSVDGTQNNSGELESTVTGNEASGTNTLNLDGNEQLLNNTQDNSGDQTATVDSSTACDMRGSTMTGNVDVNDPPSTGALN